MSSPGRNTVTATDAATTNLTPHGKLVAWAKNHGATLHPTVEPCREVGIGWSLRVRPTAGKAVQQGETLVSLPLGLTLSALNAMQDKVCTPLRSDGLPAPTITPGNAASADVPAVPPHVLSRLVLVREYRRGESSPWHPYIATLPQPGRPADWLLPAFWPDDDAAWLAGTNVGFALAEVRERSDREFNRWVRDLTRGGKAKEWEGCDDRLLWRWATCIFASRSFRPSAVLPPSVLAAWMAALAELAVEEDGEGDDGEDRFAVLLPLFDLGNHAADVVPHWVAVAAAADNWEIGRGNGLSLPTTTGTRPDSKHARVDWVASADIPPGEQVFNNYGMKTNSELLLGYGFVIPETDSVHNDYVHIRTRWESGDGEPVDEVVEQGDGAKKRQAPNSGKAKRKKDYLVSLRPMDELSSVVGRARNLLYISGDSDRELPASMRDTFAHVETELVWDMLVAQVGVQTPASKVSKGGHPEVDIQSLQGRLRRMIHQLPEEQLEVLHSGAAGALTDKLLQELHKVLAEDLDGKPENMNQELARTYREQHRKVLLKALASLGSEVEIQAR